MDGISIAPRAVSVRSRTICGNAPRSRGVGRPPDPVIADDRPRVVSPAGRAVGSAWGGNHPQPEGSPARGEVAGQGIEPGSLHGRAPSSSSPLRNCRFRRARSVCHAFRRGGPYHRGEQGPRPDDRHRVASIRGPRRVVAHHAVRPRSAPEWIAGVSGILASARSARCRGLPRIPRPAPGQGRDAAPAPRPPWHAPNDAKALRSSQPHLALRDREGHPRPPPPWSVRDGMGHAQEMVR
jgi:hypothetical protein